MASATAFWIALVGFFVAAALVQGDDGYGYRRRDRASVLSRCPNPRPYFRNGVAKLRFRGRVVKYICLPGFTLIGDPVATCYAGRWDRPVPICAAPGCRIPSRDLLTRGTVENFRNRGVMLLFRCRAGYALNGSTKAYCDGRSWNTSLPKCVPLVANPELSCNFEDPDLCGWTADLSRSNQFVRSHLTSDEERRLDNGTGPNPGHFMTVQYIGHPGLVEDVFPVARLTSPVYRPLASKSCFRFWYKLPCSLCSLRVLVWTSDTLTPVWSTYGPREPSWVNVSLSAVSEDFQLVFEARPSRKEITGLVLDDVRLELSECYFTPTTEEPPTTTVGEDLQDETGTDKEENGAVSDTGLPETFFTTSLPASNASEIPPATGSSTTQPTSVQVTAQSSAATPDDITEVALGTTIPPDHKNLTVEPPSRATTVPTARGLGTSTTPVTRPRVTAAIISTSAPKETTAPSVRSTSQSAETEVTRPKTVGMKTTAKSASTTDVNRTSSRPFTVASTVQPTQQTGVTTGTVRPAMSSDVKVTPSLPRVMTTSPSPTQRTTPSTSASLSSAPPTVIPSIRAARTQSRTSSSIRMSTAQPTTTAAATTSSLTTPWSGRKTPTVKSSPTDVPTATRSRASSPRSWPATTRMAKMSTTSKPYTTSRPATFRITSAATVPARPTRQRVTLYPLYTRYTRNTRYPLRNRTVSYIPTTQAPRVRSTGPVTRASSSRPAIASRSSFVTALPTTGEPSTGVQRTTRKPYTINLQSTTQASGATKLTTRQNLKPIPVATTAKVVALNTNGPTTEDLKSSHRAFTTEATKPAGVSTKEVLWYATKPAKPTKKTVKPYHANDFTKWTKKPTVKTTAPTVYSTKPPIPTKIHASTSVGWLEEMDALPTESTDVVTGNKIAGAVSEAPKDIEDNEIPLLNDAPVKNHRYMAKPQQSASVGEKSSSWGLLALKIGMATACAMGFALLVMFAMLRCRRRPASSFGDDSEMKPLSQFEQSEAADGAS